MATEMNCYVPPNSFTKLVKQVSPTKSETCTRIFCGEVQSMARMYSQWIQRLSLQKKKEKKN